MKRAQVVLLVLAAAGSVLMAGAARAQGAYIGVDLVSIANVLSYSSGVNEYEERYVSGHLRLRGGYRFNPNVAIEGHLMGAQEVTEVDPFGSNFTMTTGPISAIYARLDLPVGEMSSFYFLLGLASVSTKYQDVSPPVGREDSDDQAGFSFGVGFGVGFTERLKLNFDFTMYRIGTAYYPSYFGTRPDQVIGGFGIGLAYQF